MITYCTLRVIIYYILDLNWLTAGVRARKSSSPGLHPRFAQRVAAHFVLRGNGGPHYPQRDQTPLTTRSNFAFRIALKNVSVLLTERHQNRINNVGEKLPIVLNWILSKLKFTWLRTPTDELLVIGELFWILCLAAPWDLFAWDLMATEIPIFYKHSV